MDVVWALSAVRSMQDIFVWYRDYMDIGAAYKFRESILKITLHLQNNPLMGVVEPDLSLKQRDVRSVISKKYKVVYYIKDDAIYIQYIWCCKRNRSRLISLALTTDIKKR